MNKLLYLLFSIFLISGSGVAQSNASAKKILDDVSTKLKSYKGITANFSLVSKNRTGKVNFTENGKILVKGNKYYIKEGAVEIFSDGDKTWNFNGNNEVMVTTAEDAGDAITPQKLLATSYDSEYNYSLVSSAGSYYQIQMTPKDKRKNFQRVNLFIYKPKMMVTKAKVVDKGNNTIEFSLSNVNTTSSIADEAFVFDKTRYKKHIEVIE